MLTRATQRAGISLARPVAGATGAAGTAAAAAAAAASSHAWRGAIRSAAPATPTRRGLWSSSLLLASPGPSVPRPGPGHKIAPSASQLISEHERAAQADAARERAIGEMSFKDGWRRKEFWTPPRRKQLKIMALTWPIMLLSAVLLYRRMMGTDELARQQEAERELNLRVATATTRTHANNADIANIDPDAPKPLPIVFTKAEREALLKQRAAQQAAQQQVAQPRSA